MDIGYRMGFGTEPRMTKLAGFAVALRGLTENAAYGPCALRGTSVLAEASGAGGMVPAGTTYQWHSLAEGPIAGAVEASFIPDAPLPDESVIFCVVTVPEQGSRSTAHIVLRDAVPQLAGTLFDEVFDRDIGPQIVVASSVFTGLNLTYAVTGSGATIDPNTGDITVLTDSERDGDIITVTARNSGGAASAAFQVTVEDIAVEGAMPFGGLTPAGSGGVPVGASAITGGDPAGHWTITDGLLTPTAAGEGSLAGVYPLVFDSGDTLDVMIEDNKASARADEIETVFEGLPLTARGLMVQDGDVRAMGRLRLAPRVFLNEMVMEPTNWLEDADPRLSLRPVTLAALTIGGDRSDNEILRMENLTVQGFELQRERDDDIGETEFNNGIVLVENPSRHVTIRQNEIWSRDLREIIIADDFRSGLRTSRLMRGVYTQKYDGKSEHIRVEHNHMRNLSRGAYMIECTDYEGVRSRFCNNIVEDCYVNFFTSGRVDGLDIFDNRCMGVYASNDDTQSGNPPHSAAGGSFDTPGSRGTQNVTMMGNLLHIGWKRTQICQELGLSIPGIGATGVKFNDPSSSDSYWNIVVAFNTVVSHGICMQISGMSSDTYVDVFNNTLISEDAAGSGSDPLFYLTSVTNLRLFNNIAPNYTNPSNGYANTKATLQAYGNLTTRSGATIDFGEGDYCVGHPVKGTEFLTIDEAMEAYVPKPTTRAMTAGQKKGALGTGLYAGNGVHSVVYDKPAPVGGTSFAYPLRTWDGEYLRRTNGLNGTSDAESSLTFAFKGQSAASMDGSEAQLFSLTRQRVYITKEPNGLIAIKVEDKDNRTIMRGNTEDVYLTETTGLVDYVVSANFDLGVLLFAVNGVVANWVNIDTLRHGAGELDAKSPRIFANELSSAGDRWRGNLGLFYLTDEFVDLETSAGLSQFYAADGRFKDFGADGSLATGTEPLIFLSGAEAAQSNKGRGGGFTLT